MEKRRELTVEREDALLSFLREKVRDKSRNTVKGLLSRGQVLVDGALEKRFDAPPPPRAAGDDPARVRRRSGPAPLPGPL